MKRAIRALILILILFGHNFVINQAQSLQNEIQKIHKVNVTQFNLLYSIPSAIALVFIIPISLLYEKYSNSILFGAALVLLLGQILVALFGPYAGQHNFFFMVAGRTLQGTGAEVLYMIQGNLASTWMSKLAGLIFILPELGQILNAFITPFVTTKWGMPYALWLGAVGCFVSFIACWYLYCHLKQQKKVIQKIQVNLQIKNENEMISHEVSENLSVSSSKEKQSNDLGLGQNYSAGNSGQLAAEPIHAKRQPNSLLKAGKIFWLTVFLCAINECLYFPFLDNANELIQIRFKIPYEQTGYYLCLPFVAAIITTAAMNFVLKKYDRKQLLFYTAFLPFIGHSLIYFVPNTQSTQIATSLLTKACLILGFLVFGTGLGCYYSVAFPAVGLAVPQKIRGGAYGVLCFFQTLAMFVVPLISGEIIQADPKQEIKGYKNSSQLFVLLCTMGLIIGLTIKMLASKQSFHFDDYEDLLEQSEISDQSLKS